MSLVSHPAPKLGESPAGYLLRLADINGYYDLKELLNESNEIGKFHIDSNLDNLTELAKELGSVNSYELFSPASLQGNIHRENTLTFKSVIHKSPRVCSVCMSEGSDIRAEWHVMQITHCEKHHIPLIEKCTCGVDFSWDEALLSYGCSACGKAWFEFVTTNIGLPKFMYDFFKLEGNQRADFIHDITAAALTRVRPYDSILDIHRISPKHASNWIEFLMAGYDLLTTPNSYELWISSCASARIRFKSLGNRAVFYPIYRLIAQLNGEWLVKSKSPTIFNTSPVSKRLTCEIRSFNNKRNKMAEACDETHRDDAYIHHINRESIADMLETDVFVARSLFKLESFSLLTSEKLRCNNISCIKAFLSTASQTSLKVPSSAIPVSQITTYLKDFGASLADLLTAIYNGDIHSYINLSEHHYLDSIYVDRTELSTYLTGPFMCVKSRVFSMTQASRILGVPRNIVGQIANEGSIIEIPSPKNKHNYTASSIARFLEDHIVISIWASTYDFCEGKVIKSLHAEDVKAAWGHNVFKRTSKLLSVLNSIQKRDNWKSCKQLNLI